MRASRVLLAAALFLVTNAVAAQSPAPPQAAPQSSSQRASPPAPPLVPAPAPRATLTPLPYVLPHGDVPPRYRNDAMRVAGIVLTSIASAMLAAGLTVMVLDLSGGPLSDPDFKVLTVWVAAPLMLGSTLVAGAGIPLWVIGARPPEGVPPASIALGPRGFALHF